MVAVSNQMLLAPDVVALCGDHLARIGLQSRRDDKQRPGLAAEAKPKGTPPSALKPCMVVSASSKFSGVRSSVQQMACCQNP